jgi:hypothetical protein
MPVAGETMTEAAHGKRTDIGHNLRRRKEMRPEEGEGAMGGVGVGAVHSQFNMFPPRKDPRKKNIKEEYVCGTCFGVAITAILKKFYKYKILQDLLDMFLPLISSYKFKSDTCTYKHCRIIHKRMIGRGTTIILPLAYKVLLLYQVY